MSSYIEDPIGEWKKGIKDRMSFMAEPHQHRKKMLGLAYTALDRGLIDRGELSDMLEWLDCAKIWADEEMAEAEGLGLFDGCDPEGDRRSQGIVFGIRG